MKNVRVYWNCLSEMYIPTSLWESTRHMKYQIFEAMDAQQLNELMVQVFTERGQSQFQFVLSNLTVNSQLHCYDNAEQGLSLDQPRAVTCLNLSVTPVSVKVNAQTLNDLHHFIERMQSTYLIRDLKQYRPHRRPLTDIPTKIANRPTLKRKRKLIVRDWFFFVVWYIRLRKIISSFYQKSDASTAYLLFDPKYKHLIHQVIDREITLDDMLSEMKANVDKQKPIWPFKNEINVRVPSAELKIYKEQLFEIDLQKDCPKLSLHVG